MSASYIIDGYNLIHALGMIQHNMDRGGLEQSRRKLLDFLVEGFGEDAPHVTVVFDAKQAPRGVARQQQFHGLQVHFAPKDQSADDWIETLIADAAHPRTLVVVSDDMRLQKAAERRGASAWSHDALLDFLEKRARSAAAPQEPEQRGSDSAQEKEKWLKEFGQLERDPELKEFFDLDRFDDVNLSEPEA
ncbi:MAG: NYN domain-containing protein [Planctomycetes bacterium]|nr:NYN domain-containing protein [Planctomycetota bacterium]